mmetsp:Transcript_59086/g.144970  ORF Transcript_59086/g.144970 Transcript_59086/m.144970 type:complete len:159 (+) Transcript_59086:386-862(+)
MGAAGWPPGSQPCNCCPGNVYFAGGGACKCPFDAAGYNKNLVYLSTSTGATWTCNDVCAPLKCQGAARINPVNNALACLNPGSFSWPSATDSFQRNRCNSNPAEDRAYLCWCEHDAGPTEVAKAYCNAPAWNYATTQAEVDAYNAEYGTNYQLAEPIP